MDYAGYQTLRFDRRGRILTVTIDRPEALNAVNAAMHEDLARVFRDVQDDPGSDVVVLTGAGRAFCAGGDVAWFQAMIDDPAAFRRLVPEAKKIVFDLLDLEKPIVCRLNGAAAGLGATLALLCDVIVAADTARIGDPHVRMGLVAGDGGAVIWPQLVGFAKAKELLMTGEMLTAQEAERLALINHVSAGPRPSSTSRSRRSRTRCRPPGGRHRLPRETDHAVHRTLTRAPRRLRQGGPAQCDSSCFMPTATSTLRRRYAVSIGFMTKSKAPRARVCILWAGVASPLIMMT
ncbi:MAG: enoyl-CoA hydratase-related protein, partial [candidate division NC10 bacterium]